MCPGCILDVGQQDLVKQIPSLIDHGEEGGARVITKHTR